MKMDVVEATPWRPGQTRPIYRAQVDGYTWAEGDKEDLLDIIAAAVNRDAEVKNLVDMFTKALNPESQKQKQLGRLVLELYKPKPFMVADLEPGDGQKVRMLENNSKIYIRPRLASSITEWMAQDEVAMLSLTTHDVCVYKANTPCQPVEKK